MTERRLEHIVITVCKPRPNKSNLVDPSLVRVKVIAKYEEAHEVEMSSTTLRIGSGDEIKVEVYRKDDMSG